MLGVTYGSSRQCFAEMIYFTEKWAKRFGGKWVAASAVCGTLSNRLSRPFSETFAVPIQSTDGIRAETISESVPVAA